MARSKCYILWTCAVVGAVFYGTVYCLLFRLSRARITPLYDHSSDFASAPTGTDATTTSLPNMVAYGTLLTALALASTVLTIPQASNAVTASVTSFRTIPTLPPEIDVGRNMIPNVKDPQAKDAQSVCPGYNATNVQTSSTGLTALLSLAGAACNVYGTDFSQLQLTVQYQTDKRLSVNIVPRNVTGQNRFMYGLPEDIIARPDQESGTNNSSELAFAWGNSPSFWFSVTRRSNGDILFSTQGQKIIFENQFIEFKSSLPQDYNLYGLGETIHGFRLGNNLTRTLYANDQGDPIDENVYGSHPIYVETRYFQRNAGGNDTYVATGTNFSESNGANYTSYSHGVFLRNAHGQEAILKPDSITWRTIGGSIELYFLSGPSTVAVIRDYQRSITGFPAFQQYWTLGYHQCRWGYQNWSVLQDVVDRYTAANIPLETIWTDIDYMNQYRDFTTDPYSFPVNLGQEFLSRLEAGGRHYVPIVDAAIYASNPDNASDYYSTYANGVAADTFLRNQDNSTYIGAVWPGFTVFPDWLASRTVEWWVNSSVNWYKEIKFSGIWIDMSEASSFCVGSCGSGRLNENPVHPPFALPGEPGNVIYDYPEGFNSTNATEAASALAASSSQASVLSVSATATATATVSTISSDYYRPTVTAGVRNVNYPPYVLNHFQTGYDLSVHAVSPNATSADGTLQYDIHNLNGHQILNATYQALQAVFPGKRPFIIGRSTFAGSGKWAGHWGGDNYSKWAYMYFSIPQALSFSIFGFPMFGPDTCGFNGNTDEELCNRWMQLSAFFPFYRNHNTYSANSQEAYIWASVAQATRDAMRIRGLLLPYMYTLMYNAHAKGETVLRALAWEFPNNPSLANADRQFFLGPAILVTPNLVQGATAVNGVFPGASEKYYDWYTQLAVNATPGANTTIPAPLGHIPVYIRGGYVLGLQDTALTTKEARTKPYSILAALSSNGTASGQLYLDDGESITPNSTTIVSFRASASSRTLSVSSAGNFTTTPPLANITILGLGQNTAPGTNSTVRFGQQSLPSASWSYNITSQVLKLTNLTSLTASRGAWNGTTGYTVSW